MRERLSFSNVVSMVALFVALAGGAYALESGSIGSREIKDGALKSKDFKDRNLKGKDLKDATVTARQIKDDTIGSGDLATAAVGSGEIADGGIGSADVADGGIGSAEVGDNSLTGADVNESTLFGVRPGGNAGGALNGTYPNPTLDAGSVGTDEQAVPPHFKGFGGAVTPDDGIVTDLTLGSPTSISEMTFDNAADTVEVDVPGLYAINAFVTWDPNGTGRRVVQIELNDFLTVEDSRPPVVGARTSQAVTTLQRLPAGTEIGVTVQQTSGGSLGTAPAGAPPQELNVWWVGP